MISNEPIIIFGDGNQTRDFVHVDDIVQANINSAQVKGINGAFNIASGTSISINELVEIISYNSKNEIKIEYQNPRSGDVLNSLADISFAKKHLNYTPRIELKNGIHEYIEWARNFYSKMH
jgi:UDP-glucose 4-epimerase